MVSTHTQTHRSRQGCRFAGEVRKSPRHSLPGRYYTWFHKQFHGQVLGSLQRDTENWCQQYSSTLLRVDFCNPEFMLAFLSAPPTPLQASHQHRAPSRISTNGPVCFPRNIPEQIRRAVPIYEEASNRAYGTSPASNVLRKTRLNALTGSWYTCGTVRSPNVCSNEYDQADDMPVHPGPGVQQ